jgi:hypothetical protein
MSKKEKTIMIEGVKLTRGNFPVLFEWAETHPDMLSENLRANTKRFKCTPNFRCYKFGERSCPR